VETTCTMLTCSAKWSWLNAWAMKIARHRGMKKAIVALARRLAGSCVTSGSTAPNSDGPGRSPQHENRTGSNQIEENWDPPNGGMMSLAGQWMR